MLIWLLTYKDLPFPCLSISQEACFRLLSSPTCLPKAPGTSAGQEGGAEPLLAQRSDDDDGRLHLDRLPFLFMSTSRCVLETRGHFHFAFPFSTALKELSRARWVSCVPFHPGIQQREGAGCLGGRLGAGHLTWKVAFATSLSQIISLCPSEDRAGVVWHFWLAASGLLSFPLHVHGERLGRQSTRDPRIPPLFPIRERLKITSPLLVAVSSITCLLWLAGQRQVSSCRALQAAGFGDASPWVPPCHQDLGTPNTSGHNCRAKFAGFRLKKGI